MYRWAYSVVETVQLACLRVRFHEQNSSHSRSIGLVGRSGHEASGRQRRLPLDVLVPALPQPCGMLLVTLTTIAANGSWTKVSDGPWTPREGLMAVATPNGILMTGGRVLHGARATNDVCERATPHQHISTVPIKHVPTVDLPHSAGND